jgi:hypothetical protein
MAPVVQRREHAIMVNAAQAQEIASQMEPAMEWRECQQRHHPDDVHPGATMEPALGRQEHGSGTKTVT